MTNKTLEAYWAEMTRYIGTSHLITSGTFIRMKAQYSQPHRHYHNLAHIRQMLEEIDKVMYEVIDLPTLRLAIWFHDSIYEPQAEDNEAQSAQLAENTLTTWGLPEGHCKRVADMILATEDHQAAEDDLDLRFMLDADLSILGSLPEKYDVYAQAIRMEYNLVPEEVYKQKRIKFLENILMRINIFNTDEFAEAYEQQARANMQRELRRLREG